MCPRGGLKHGHGLVWGAERGESEADGERAGGTGKGLREADTGLVAGGLVNISDISIL